MNEWCSSVINFRACVMCSHAGHSNTRQPIARLSISPRHSDLGQWVNVMNKSHQLAQQQAQQEQALLIQNETSIGRCIYPQIFLQLKHSLELLKPQQTLKVKTASVKIKIQLAAIARQLHYKIENLSSEQYLYLTNESAEHLKR